MGWDSKRSYPVDVSTKVTVQATASQKSRWKAAAYRKGLETPGAFLAWAADVFLEMEEAYKKQVDRHLNECNPPSRTYP
jgi:hypothetical protein